MQSEIKKIIILGAGPEQTPAIKLCKSLKIKSVVCDKNKNAYGKKYSDYFFPYNITDYKKILNLTKKLRVNGIITFCSDLAVPIAAKISNKFQLPGNSLKTSLLTTHKGEMKRCFERNNISTPKFEIIDNLTQYYNFLKLNKFPLVLKPTDSSGQKGIFLIRNNLNIKKKFFSAKRISSDKKLIIEKFHNGYEINIVALVENKNVKFLSISHRKTSHTKNFGIATHHIYPTKLNNKEISNVKKICKKAIKAIKLDNGIVYPQIMMTGKNKFELLEIASRLPGGFMREMSLMVSGIDPIEFLLKKMTGQKKVLKNIKKAKKYKAVYIKFFTKLDFINKKFIKKIENIDKAKNSKGVYKFFFKENFSIPKLKLSRDRFGAIIVFGENTNDSVKNYKKALNKVKFITN